MSPRLATFARLAAKLFLCWVALPLACAEPWSIVIGEGLVGDEAVRLAVQDLTEAGAGYELTFTVADGNILPPGNVLLAGAPERNSLTAKLAADGALTLENPADPQGYCIRSVHWDGRRIIAVAGGSVIGDVYGLYWVWDRIRVHKRLPEVNVVRSPALKTRLGAVWGRYGYGGSTKEQMHVALRHSTNWVAGPAVLDLVPWNAEPEATANAANREKARELIAYARRLHMKYFAFANEFTYHPSLLEEYGATLSPDDPKFWDAVQGKFRKLFEALPDLDGVKLCNDDLSGFWDNYRAYDLLHENPECEWSYPKRFRTFVQKVHEVVAGEFGKTYFHFTWSLRAHEQHTQADVFREIFTDAVPTENLYLVPKITAADRWWHQPYNPTFNLTPHETLVCFETMNYYEGGGTPLFPTWSGQYFQGGLQTFLMPEETNVRGAATLAGASKSGWDTTGAYAYVLYRLMWDPYDDMETIARDFCSIHFGPEAAEAMARIYSLSASAYKYGLHIEPVSYGQFNSFIHMRVGTFPVEGYPDIDGGREHVEFLRRIYLRCNPWRQETLDDLEHGLDVTRRMRALFEEAKPHLQNGTLVRDIEQRLDMTRLLIETNIGYVRLMFAYFDYVDAPSEIRRAALDEAYNELVTAREAFMAAPGFKYNLFGIDQFMKNAKAALDDAHAAKAALADAPTRKELEATIADQQRRYGEALEKHGPKAVRLAHVEVLIDGQDILNITGDQWSIDHIRWDGPHVRECTLFAPLPSAEVTVIPKDIQSRPLHPFVIEQPTAENNYTARVYLDDLPGGQDWFVFDLYYIPEKPEALGLQLPWK